ncbi:chorismate mutase [Thermodesulfobacteriota bacterium]
MKPSKPKNRNQAGLYSISELRESIDEIDTQILDLINRRLQVVMQIGKIKSQKGVPIIDNGRENLLIRRLLSLNEGPIDREALRRIFNEIIGVCREIQKTDDR